MKTPIILTVIGVFAFSNAFAAKNQDSEKTISRKIDRNSYAPKEPSKHAMGVGIGQTFLLGDFEGQGDDSITIDAIYTYEASHSFDLMLSAHVSKHETKNKSIELFGLSASIKAKVFDFDSFSPYFLGGLGFYQPQETRFNGVSTETTERKMVFGFNVGAGTDLKLNEDYTLGMMGVLHKPFNVKQDERTDVRGMYFKLLMALSYNF
ncbi:MAG: outer membrane beta-barrel protein [Bacteriovoracaceae bacterium]|nr:outer membrane beta-barrel protein [Bacteriovoracaceae bacterium]